MSAEESESHSLYMGAAFAFVFNSRGEILLLREDSKKRKYEWDMPGGTLEQEETPIEGLHREVLEETKLSIEIIHPMCFLKWDRHENGCPILVAFYLAKLLTEDMTLSAEHTRHRWVTLNMLKEEEIKLPPGRANVEIAFSLYGMIKSNE
jgi:8-oxo-dGTP diphosphatase